MVKDNVMPETIEKLNNWRENKKSKQINVNRIVITHPIHQKTETIDFNGRINQLSYIGNKPIPIVVKKKRCGKYNNFSKRIKYCKYCREYISISI